ncbi:uncharacterized protein LOC114268864 [Camellia sinensis]|uniref:uncharacterized protein LOC114268864 n=1 Tax=Camellia sinensis TaxID=4442 RepID=UPI0010366D0F|nr:uncharacterized protein LOC114268864 [Camellia sinensis]
MKHEYKYWYWYDTGIFNLFQEPIRVLFDTGASHSFISRQFIEREHLVTTFLSRPICVETPLEGAITLYEMCKDFEIDFTSRVLYVDLIVLGFEGFVIILDMDWLQKHFVTLDCAGRTINIDILGMPRLTHTSSDGEKSVMTSYLCSVEIPKQNISEVDVVCEFENVFQEIPGPPPRRVVEFRIDLVLGTAPISKVAYKMAPKELVEMKKQLEEIL